MPKKVLILYTSVGLGHKSIAENVGYYLRESGYEVRLEDILKVEAGMLASLGQSVHHFVNTQMPWLWSTLYQSDFFNKLTLGLRVPLAAKNHAATKAIVDEYEPDLIITTQVTASAVVAYMKRVGLYDGTFAICFSDYHLHPYWLFPEADAYLVNTEEQKSAMRELGIVSQVVGVCGMTLKPVSLVDTVSVRSELGIPAGNKVVLVGSGSLGSGISDELLVELSPLPNVSTVVVCGKNTDAFRNLVARFAGTSVVPLGYHEPMEELYSIADIFVTKPGGLTVAEALRYQLPLLISHVLPGQEELNYQYLSERGLVMPEPVTIVSAVTEELERGTFRSELKKNSSLSLLIGDGTVAAQVVDGLLKR